jgi:hypothetical protein
MIPSTVTLLLLLQELGGMTCSNAASSTAAFSLEQVA